jgi:outer membrane protein insertion porin family
VEAVERYPHLYGKIVKEIRITGAESMREYIVRRELASTIGEPYTAANAAKDYERLDNLGIFSDIDLVAQEEDGVVVITIEVKETFRYLPVVSFSIDDENGISVGGGLKSVNLLGKGVSLSAVARFGGATSVEAILKNPWIAGNHFGYQFEYFHRDRRNELYKFDETADEFFLTLSSYLEESGRIGARYSLQHIQSNEPGRTISADHTDLVSTLGLFFGYDTRDLWSNPSNGWWNELAFEKVGLFGDKIDFMRAHIDIRRFLGLRDRHVIAFFSLTSLSGGTVLEDIAMWQLYSLGGTNSIRGWELGSVTGKHQCINTLEYRYTLLEPRTLSFFGINAYLGLQLAAFADAGSAWTDNNDFRRNFIDGYGLGIRFIVPYVGLARLDFGFGQPSGKILVHFDVSDKPVRQRERVR